MVHGVLVSIEMRCMSDHSLFPILFLFGIPGGIPSPQGGEGGEAVSSSLFTARGLQKPPLPPSSLFFCQIHSHSPLSSAFYEKRGKGGAAAVAGQTDKTGRRIKRRRKHNCCNFRLLSRGQRMEIKRRWAKEASDGGGGGGGGRE